MLLLDTSTKRRVTRQGTRRSRERTRIVVPSGVRGTVPEFLDEVEFGAFGKLERNAVQQPKTECSTEIVRWLALHQVASRHEAQKQCAAQNPAWFQNWNVARIFDRSLRVPHNRGPVAMYVIEDPIAIPGDPPASVLERYEMAMRRYPEAAVFYLEPFFDNALDADAKVLTAGDLNEAVDEHWARLWRKTRHWGWFFRFERAVIEWQALRVRKRELRLRSELYLEMLRQRENEASEAPKSEVRQRVALDDRLAARRREREAQAARAASWVDQQLALMPAEVRRGVDELEAEVTQLEQIVRARGPMTSEEARLVLDRRQFNVAVMLGLVAFPRERYLRRDPLLVIQLPDETFVRLVGHWDRWMADVNGEMKLCTFVHV